MVRRTREARNRDKKSSSPEPLTNLRETGAARTIGLFLVGSATVCVTSYYCAYLGLYSMFTGFGRWDDEGAMMYVLARLAKGRALYDQIAIMYGPVGFLPKLALMKLFSIPITHESMRYIGLACWCTTTAMFGATAWRLAKSVLWFGIAMAATFVALRAFYNLPGHPQEVCILFISAGILLSTFEIGRRPWILVALGVLTGLLCMTKINLGVFYAAALWATIGLQMQECRLRKFILATALAGFTVGPFLLMRDSLRKSWVWEYALTVSTALVACMIVAIMLKLGRTAGRQLLTRTLIGFFAAVIVVCLVTMATGTSAFGLWNGVIAFPAHVINTHRIGIPWTTDLEIPAIGFCSAMIATFRLSKSAPTFRFRMVIGLLRVVAGLTILWLTLEDGGGTIARELLIYNVQAPPNAPLILAWAPAAMWLLFLPQVGAEDRSGDSWPRMLLGFAAILESLWAFPVAGGSMCFAAMLLVMASCIIAADGLADLIHLSAASAHEAGVRFVAAGLLLLATTQSLTSLEGQARDRYFNENVPLGLTGCDGVRVHRSSAVRYRTVVEQLKANADVIFCVPGMASFSFWSQLPLAGSWNATDWMELFTPQQEEDVIAALRNSERPCIVYDEVMKEGWMQHRKADSKLLRYIDQEFRPAYQTPEESGVEVAMAVYVRRDRSQYVVTLPDGSIEQVLKLAPPKPPKAK